MSKKNKKYAPAQQAKSGNSAALLKNSSRFNFYTISLLLVVLVASWLRYRLAPMPLERDEGEYAYMGKLILEGIPPYKEAYNMKLPGTYYMYSIIMLLFGKTYTGIHIGLMFMNAGTMILMFVAGKKLFSPMTGLIAAATYGLMSISPNFLGFAAHATHFVSFYAALGLYFFSKYDEHQQKYFSLFNSHKSSQSTGEPDKADGRGFVRTQTPPLGGGWEGLFFALLTGIMFGMAFLMKQQALFFILFGGVVVLISHFLNKPLNIKKTIIDTLIYSIGVFIPYILVVLLMIMSGNFDKFWFWTVEYASKYATGLNWEEGQKLLDMTFKPMWDEFTILWLLALGGVAVLFIGKYSLKQRILGISFSLFAILSVCPGFFFRQHYFICLLPAVGLMAGISLDYLGSMASQKLKVKALTYVPFILFILIAGNSLSKNKPYYFKVKPMQLCKAIYGSNPFTESVEIAKYINKNSSEDDKIAVLGSEPQLFLYADRHSATGYIYTYAMMEIHDYNKKMQEEMISEIEQNKPKFLVFCRISTSWLARPGSPMLVFDWFNKYSQANYELVGIADMVGQMQTSYYWDMEAKMYQPKGQEYVMVFKRKSSNLQ